MKNLLLIIAVLFGILNGMAQEDKTQIESIKPLRLGIKIGIPSIITGNLEYVTPLFDNRVAISGDFMAFNKTIEEDEVDYGVDYSTYEIGTNIYLSPTGKGLYLGISYLSFDGVYTETGSENTTGDFKFNTTNLKIGVKLGRTFYFRAEVGYGFGDIPEEIILASPNGDIEDVIDIPDIPGLSSSGLPVFNIGFGFSFL